MSKTLTKKSPATYLETITRFDGGISRDIRESLSNSFGLTKHFDIFSKPKRLIPYVKTEADETVAGTPKDGDIVKFIYAPLSATFRLFGYGENTSAVTLPAIYLHDADLTATGWTLAANGALTGVTNQGRNKDVFFHYKNYLYGWNDGTSGGKLWRFGDLTSSPTIAGGYQSINFTNVAQPVHHPADDIAYFFSDNNVHTLNNTSWTTNALVLPDNLKIVSATALGNYLAIGCSPLSALAEESVIYLWDRDSSLTTISSKIQLGKGELKHIANLNGNLIAVIDFFMNNSQGLREGKMIVKRIIGDQALTINEILTDSSSDAGIERIFNTLAVKEDKMYFPANIGFKGDTKLGIWVVDENGRITIDTVEEDLTGINKTFEGIYATGNVWWIAHSNDGSINRSDNNLVKSFTSIYESQIFHNGDISQTKKLLGVTVMTEPLETDANVVLKYRKDEETAFTQIFTHTEDNSLRHSSVNIESSGATLPVFKEIQFRIESTFGAVITGLKFKYELVPDDKY